MRQWRNSARIIKEPYIQFRLQDCASMRFTKKTKSSPFIPGFQIIGIRLAAREIYKLDFQIFIPRHAFQWRNEPKRWYPHISRRKEVDTYFDPQRGMRIGPMRRLRSSAPIETAPRNGVAFNLSPAPFPAGILSESRNFRGANSIRRHAFRVPLCNNPA
jgi:hypothetical protein